jgi:hypothetical protein
MANEPVWMRLLNVANRLMASGIAEITVQSDICGAMADGKIDVRVRTGETEDGLTGWPMPGGEIFQRDSVVVPTHLRPTDFDWVNSRPLKPWRVRPRSVPEQYDGTFHRGPWNIAFIELWREDVDKLWPTENWSDKGPATDSVPPKSDRPQRKAPPKQETVNAFMIKRIKNWPSDEPRPTLAEDLQAARDKLKADVRRNQIVKARQAHAPEEWTKRGPRSR